MKKFIPITKIIKTEDNLRAGVKVFWRNKEYTTGDRGHGLVELYKDNKFIRCVCFKSLKIL